MSFLVCPYCGVGLEMIRSSLDSWASPVDKHLFLVHGWSLSELPISLQTQDELDSLFSLREMRRMAE